MIKLANVELVLEEAGEHVHEEEEVVVYNQKDVEGAEVLKG